MDGSAGNLAGQPEHAAQQNANSNAMDVETPTPAGIPGLGLLSATAPAPASEPAPVATEIGTEAITTTAVPDQAEVTAESNDATMSAAAPVGEGEPFKYALEALLGGLEPQANTQTTTVDTTTVVQAAAPVVETLAVKEEEVKQEGVKQEDIAMENTAAEPTPAPTAAISTTTAIPDVLAVAAAVLPNDSAMMDYIPPAAGAVTAMGQPAEEENVEDQFAEDSDPYQSSSSDSSDDSSSEEDSDDEDAYQLLDPHEQARILMEEGDGDDGEGGGKGGSGGQLRTKNEVPEEVIPKPDVTITPEMKLEVLGEVEAVVENMVLIKAKTSGEYNVLESGSVLCLEDRSVIGAVADTIGRVEEPLYVVRFTNNGEVAKAGVAKGVQIFYTERFSTFVFTQQIKQFKGSDASNLHDEEVGDEEIEFSDDDAEMEHKRRIKQKKLEKRGIRPGDRGGRGGHADRPHPLRQEIGQPQHYNPAQGISYDDEEDGPYKPLARPSGYANTVGKTEAPEEGASFGGRRPSHSNDNPSFAGRGRGGSDRGRGGRGGGDRGGRGRGNDRGGRGGARGGAHAPQQQQYPPAPADAPKDPRKLPGYVAPSTPAYGAFPNPYAMPPPQAGQFQIPPGYQSPPANPYMAFPQPPAGWTPPAPQANGQQRGVPQQQAQQGAYINPAFFQQMAMMQQMAQAQQHQQNGGQATQPQQWPQQQMPYGWLPAPAPQSPPQGPQKGGSEERK